MVHSDNLPPFICGPLLRRLTRDQLVIWWVSPKPVEPDLECRYPGEVSPFYSVHLDERCISMYKFGAYAYGHLADIRPENPFPNDRKILYDLLISEEGGQNSLSEYLPHIVYPEEKYPSFVVRHSVRRFFHGSCRKPHHDSEDAFMGLDREIEATVDNMAERPGFLMLTGDQIYADDVAGPMLQAIHQVIKLLGLYGECFDDAVVADADELYARPECYYGRKEILPKTKVGDHWFRRGGAKHIFSSAFAYNHLISFAEWMGMYLLVWSPVLWRYIDVDPGEIPVKYKAVYEKEQQFITAFQGDLPRVQRLLAHIPTYMIFDDHDVTDDWNLTAKWEQQAYSNRFTRRIIGNGLMAYFLCQGWGNAPDTFTEDVLTSAKRYFSRPDKENHDQFIQSLLGFTHWHYEVPVSPELIVIDSRTRRWKRQRRPSSPSGLLDWEALMKLQHKLMKSDAVLLVAPGPIFGVKLIEFIQRMFTLFGYSLTVDAENWMAHRKSAYIILEIFKNAKTASRNVIISGDVHYSFAYDVELRFVRQTPFIWQITSSGIKNEFPERILRWLDRLNQLMYGPDSPLNRFTKRRDLVIHERIPKGRENERLISACGIGRVILDEKGAPVEIAEIYPDGSSLKFSRES